MNPKLMTHLQPFIKTIETLGLRYNTATVFDDFLTATMNFFTPPNFEPMDIATFSKYSEKERLKLGSLVPELILTYHKFIVSDTCWIDPLGNMYEDITLRSKSKMMGQYFTPEHICDFMVQLNSPEDNNSAKRVNDPACGSGRMLLAYHAAYPGNYTFAEDLDKICCKMTAINMLVHGCQGEVVHHNALMLDDYINGWRINETLPTLGIPSLRPMQKEESFIMSHKPLKKTSEPVKLPSEQVLEKTINLQGTQLTFF